MGHCQRIKCGPIGCVTKNLQIVLCIVKSLPFIHSVICQ